MRSVARLGSDFFHRESTVIGSTKLWLWLAGMTSLTSKSIDILQPRIIILTILSGGFCTHTVNIPDFSPVAKMLACRACGITYFVFLYERCILQLLARLALNTFCVGVSQALCHQSPPLDIVAIWQTSPGRERRLSSVRLSGALLRFVLT
jgi:hypothetical protein